MVNFMRFRKLYFLISAAFLVPGVLSLIFFGLKQSIDFTGGTLWEIRLQGPDPAVAVEEEIEKAFGAAEIPLSSVTPAEGSRFIIRTVPLKAEEHDTLLEVFRGKLGEVEETRFETLGPTLGRELLNKAFLAVGLAVLTILAYIAYRFKDLMYGATAILAMLHDSLILLGVFSVLGYFFGVEVGALFVTAVLTTLSFSVHDTVVVFDRIREILRRDSSLGMEVAVNQAVGETLVRSLNNSLTIIFMLLALLLLGGESLRWFVFALLLGTIAGTYSSTFTAAPLLLVWGSISKRIRERRGS
jgi:preprotein translocase subunit SecF